MLYLGIDQHSKQLTVCVRDESGRVIQRRQVSTMFASVLAFLDEIQALSRDQGGFAVALEVCGFNDWLLVLLKKYECRHIVLIHPDKRSKRKTDRRDANVLGEVLWLNRERLAAGQKLQGLRRVVVPTAEDQAARELTALRQRAAQRRTKAINKIQNLLRRHNLMWECPTKGFQTIKVQKWLRAMIDKPRPELTSADRITLVQMVEQWKMWEDQLLDLEAAIRDMSVNSRFGELDQTSSARARQKGAAPFHLRRHIDPAFCAAMRRRRRKGLAEILLKGNTT